VCLFLIDFKLITSRLTLYFKVDMKTAAIVASVALATGVAGHATFQE
jgi:hypothetical protein